MAYAPTDSNIERQYKAIARAAREVGGRVVVETNKRVIVKLRSRDDARACVALLKQDGFPRCPGARGRRTPAWYVEVNLNY